MGEDLVSFIAQSIQLEVCGKLTPKDITLVPYLIHRYLSQEIEKIVSNFGLLSIEMT